MSPSTARLAMACGLAMLIPLPLLDEYVARRITRRMFAGQARERGVELPDEALHLLTEDRSSMVTGCLVALVIWPLKKLFRTVLYFLTVKDVLDAATVAAHRATMMGIALDAGVLPANASEVRALMDTVLARYRTSPVSRSLWLQDRPALDLAPPTGWGRALRWLQRHGAGGLLVPEFRSRLPEVCR